MIYVRVDVAAKFIANKQFFDQDFCSNYLNNLNLNLFFILDFFHAIKFNFANEKTLKFYFLTLRTISDRSENK